MSVFQASLSLLEHIPQQISSVDIFLVKIHSLNLRQARGLKLISIIANANLQELLHVNHEEVYIPVYFERNISDGVLSAL